MTDESLFARAVAIPDPAERAAFLDRECAGNPDLRREIESLLAAHAGGGFLDRPAAGPAVTSDLSASPPSATSGVPVAVANNTPGPGVGTVIGGKYKLVEEIGEGGMGSVWMAQQTEPVKRLVAVKLIKAGMDSKAVLARFEAERQALALMDHPNIATVLDAGAAPDGRPFVVMELVKGVPITTFCDDRRLTAEQRLELFVPVCQAVQHAHQKGVIHRDLKPSNVLVALSDGRPVPKVIDFGLAKAAGEPLTDRTLATGFGVVVGTPEYMSPEQASFGTRLVDTRTDVYALGGLLYELLAGSPPFARPELEARGVLEILRVVREEEPPRPSDKLSTADALPTLSANRGTDPARLTRLLRGELDWIVMKCLEKDRDRRYETAAGLAADVQRYLTGEPVLAHPPSAGYRLKKFLRRNRGRVAAGVAAVLAMAGAAYAVVESRQRREVTGLLHEATTARGRVEDLLGTETRLRSELQTTNGKLETALKGEQAALKLAEREREKVARFEYGRTVQVAHQEARDGAAVALALLESTRADLRGWEWRYVHRLCNGQRLTLKGHDGWVQSACFRPDGARVLTAGGDHTARVWDARSGAGLLVLKGHAGDVHSAGWSPDGAKVVTAGLDRTARVWDAKTGDELLALEGHKGWVSAAAFGPDGMKVATGSDDRTARVWDARSGVQLAVLRGHGGEVHAAGWSPDGARVVTASEDGTARVWDVKTGAEVRVLRGHVRRVRSAAFGPDGSTVVTASEDGTARVWDADGAADPPTFKGHASGVDCGAWSPDGSRVATASEDGTARIWDAATGEPLRVLEGHTGRVNTVAWGPDGARVVTASVDGTARVWDAATGRELLTLAGHTATVHSAAWSRDGSRVVTAAEDRTARVWDAATGAEVLVLTHPRWVRSAAFSPDGARVATATDDRAARVRVWDAGTGRELLVTGEHSVPLYSAVFSPGWVQSVVWSADGGRLLTASMDGTARVWDPTTGKELLAFRGHVRRLRSAAFGPDGSRVVTASEDGTARVWDAATGAELLTLKGHAGWVRTACFSPDGGRLLTASADGTARVWDATPLEPQFRSREIAPPPRAR
ncbi:MAG: hypothetical protein C0501_11020 [Isosphaera sp.]|nr:hypothetical protein [Isosphaera sp.]